jgi:integrase
MKTVTLGEAVDVFLGEYIPTTRRTYKEDLVVFMSYVSPSLPLEEIKSFDVLRAVQNYEKRPGVKSVHTVNKFIKHVGTFFRWAVRTGLISKAPIDGVRKRAVPQANEGNSVQKAMPDALFQRMVKFYQDLALLKPKQYARALALIMFLGDGGARRGGAVGLRWSDVNLKLQFATVTEKGQKTRKVWFGKATKAALIQWKIAQKAEAGDYVFHQKGAKVSAAALSQFFRRRCIEAGIGSWGTHSLRHRKGVQLRVHKIPTHVAAKSMGISDNVYAKHYGNPDDEALEKAIREVAFGEEGKPLPVEKEVKNSGALHAPKSNEKRFNP